jgi:hypothetical protein
MPEANQLLSQAAMIQKGEREALTPAEKLIAYGDPGPVRTTMFKAVGRDGRRVMLTRVFGADETIPEGWVDSPAKLGVETEPARAAPGTNPEEFMRELPPLESVAETPAKAKAKG